MFKFNKNSDLLETIEKQNATITRYEGRLRDIVQAYKSLQKEKEALEASITALSSSHDEKNETKKNKSDDNEGDAKNLREQDGDNTTIEESDSTDIETDELTEQRKTVQKLQTQLQTVTQSLATVTAEKSKIVASYQADKKKLKSEQEECDKRNAEEQSTFKSKITELEESLEKAHDKIREQQKDREQEQTTHSIMLKELQNMLNAERNKKDELNDKVDELKSEIAAIHKESRKHTDALNKSQQNDDAVREAAEKLQKQEKINEALTKEMYNSQVTHRVEMEKQRGHASELEKRVKEVSRLNEERVESLEKQISELSKNAGRHTTEINKSRQDTLKLQEIIRHLQSENTMLLQKMNEQEGGITMNKMTDEEIQEKIEEYKSMLEGHAVNEMNYDVVLSDEEQKYRNLYFDTLKQLRQTQDAMDNYKRSKQHSDDSSYSSDHDIHANESMYALKHELNEVRDRHLNLRNYADDLEDKIRRLELKHEETLLELKDEQQAEIKSVEESYNARASELEREMRMQRERTVELLDEKDREIEMLKSSKKSSLYARDHSRTLSSGSTKTSSTTPHEGMFTGVDSFSETTNDPVGYMLNEKEMSSSTLFHYSEELARKDIAIQCLRKQKKQLELQLRKIHEDEIIKSDQHERDMNVLKKKISHMERSTIRESANLEYLKNVLYQYLTTKNYQAKQRMLQAVTTILQFSEDETKAVLK